MIIGYARISTSEQNLDLQKDALKNAGCENIYSDVISGSKSERPGLNSAISHLRAGDTLVVWKLDRLGRSIQHLIDTVKALNDKGIAFKSLQDSIDTSTTGGKLVFHIFCALAEFERDLIIERTNAGLKAARARGRKGGRRYALDEKQRKRVRELYNERSTTVNEICRMYNISKRSLYNYVESD
jgi:DNA invertase Pin-like site-specific DNA recombinase